MSPTLRIILVFTGLEVVFVPFISAAFIACLEVNQGKGIAIAVFVTLMTIMFVISLITIVLMLRPIERWRALPEHKVDRDVIFSAARAAYRAPYIFAVSYVGMLTVVFPLSVVILLVFYPDAAPLDPHVKPGILLLALAVTCGPTAYSFPMIEFLLFKEINALSARVHTERIPFHGWGVSLAKRFMIFGIVACGAATLWMTGTQYLDNARGRSRLVEAENELAVTRLAEAARTPDPATGQRPAPEALVDAHPGSFLLATGETSVRGAAAKRILDGYPKFLQQVQQAAATSETGKLRHIQSGVVVAYAKIDSAHVLGSVAESNIGVSSGFWAIQGPFLFLILTWGPMSAWLMSRSSITPIQRVSSVLEEIRNGRVEKTEPVTIYHHDETGKLSANVNGMLDVLRTLSAQARSIGTGDLSTSFSIGGDLGDAFRAQLESLRSIVGTLAQSAVQLSAAANELYAASQEQETAAGHQSAGVNEVGKTMETLLAAAAHISEATQGVLSRAERTRETTDRTAQKIGELSTHAGRIGEILDVIREIADRSDLLALNASLEGTRAGEAGRGFTLVAAEMRKLAERVMASVHDIKQLVADVRASVASTIMVTEESSKLADGTTESARQISLVTQQQSSGTEQAAQSMRDVATMLTQSLSATQQMRSLAGNLKGQAEQLSVVVARFRIADGADRPT